MEGREGWGGMKEGGKDAGRQPLRPVELKVKDVNPVSNPGFLCCPKGISGVNK